AATNTVFAARHTLKFAPPERSPQNVELVGRQTGDDTGWGVNAGVLWNITDTWTTGATFRQGPEFRYLAQTTTGAATLGQPGVTFVDRPDSVFKVPDTWALGLAFRPSNFWRVGFEYDRIYFSQLFDRTLNTATPEGDPEGALAAERITLDDANEFRLGGEYSRHVLGRHLLSLRAGVWHAPRRVPYFRVDDPATGYPGPAWALLFPKRSGET